MKNYLKHLALFSFLSLYLVTGWIWPVWIMVTMVWVLAIGLLIAGFMSLTSLNPVKFAFQKFREHHEPATSVIETLLMFACVSVIIVTLIIAGFQLTMFAYLFVVVANIALRAFAKLSRNFY